MQDLVALIARVTLAALFIVTGFGQLGDWQADAAHYIREVGLPGILLPLVIVFEIGAGFALLAGVQTRWIALALAAFCVLTALFVHLDFGDATQAQMFLKNLAMAGGLLMLYAHGAGAYSVDARFGETLSPAPLPQAGEGIRSSP